MSNVNSMFFNSLNFSSFIFLAITLIFAPYFKSVSVFLKAIFPAPIISIFLSLNLKI